MKTPPKVKSSKTVTPRTFSRVKKSILNSVLLKTAHQGECWKLRQKVNGRGHSQIKHENVKYLAHRIMASGTLYQPYDALTKNDASHLCGNHDCVNPDHLTIESASYNQTRDCCHRLGHTVNYKCPHQPPCTYVKDFCWINFGISFELYWPTDI